LNADSASRRRFATGRGGTGIIQRGQRFPEQETGATTMKLVIAYIQPEKLSYVKKALYEREVYKMSVTNAMGCGQQKGYTESYRGVDFEVNLLKKVRVEIAVNEDFVQPTIDGIIEGARSGNIGDGKIFIVDLPECIRIRTGEKGSEAIG